MADEQPAPIVPALLGGAVAAVLINASHRDDTRRLASHLDGIAALERERLAEAKKHLQAVQAESRRNDTHRAYEHDVLWLSHCNNEERLDHLIARQREVFVERLAGHVAAEISSDPRVSEQRAALVDTRGRLEQIRHEHTAWQHDSAALRRRRWSARGVCLVVFCLALAILLPLSRAFGSVVIAHGLIIALALALLSPVIVKLQPAPARSRGDDAAAPARTFARHQARHALVGILRAQLIARLERQSASHREELRRLFSAGLPAWAASADCHVEKMRPLIESAHRDYPPRVRCDLAALSDAAIFARLCDSLPATLTRKLETLT